MAISGPWAVLNCLNLAVFLERVSNGIGRGDTQTYDGPSCEPEMSTAQDTAGVERGITSYLTVRELSTGSDSSGRR